MKKLLLSLLLVAGVAHADNEFRFTPNNAGGYIFFTTSNCIYLNTGERVPNQYYVYSTNKTGVKSVDGCYSYNAPFYFIEWNGGGKTTIDANTTQPINK